ncbi:hypothetical protein [Sphingobium ummariense]
MMRARFYDAGMCVRDVDLIVVAGDDIVFNWRPENPFALPARPVAFTSMMTRELGQLVAVVIGVSGTGTIIAEQAARLGSGPIDWLRAM